MAREIYVNLPVKDLNKSKEFFGKLGFQFNPKFTNDEGACMIIGDSIYAMLLVEPFFKQFTKKEIANASKSTEVILAISAESREAVNDMVEKALKAGGSKSNDPQDYGWMYSRSFQDIDGHQWEVLHADESAIPEQP
jgi:uncharacterized protein